MIWLMLTGEAGDAQDWKKRLVREGYEPDGAAFSGNRASRWRHPAGGVATTASIRPVQGTARDICVFRPGGSQSLADAPSFFRGRNGVEAKCSRCEPVEAESFLGSFRTSAADDDGAPGDPSGDHPAEDDGDAYCFACGSTEHDTGEHAYLEAKGKL